MAYPNLEAEMRRNGITKTDLAAFLGRSLPTISGWTHGENGGFSVADAMRVREHYFKGLSLDYLFADKPITKPNSWVEV